MYKTFSKCEKQCRMAKMKIVRVLLFLLLLAGEYQLQSASIEAHCTPLMAANRQNLLCTTNVLLLDKRMTIKELCLPQR